MKLIKTIPIFLMLFTVFSFAGCSNGISGKEAKEHINGFFRAIETKDYDHASTFLHPEISADPKTVFENLEHENNLDFSAITITKYTGFSSSYYNSAVQGSLYTLNMKVDAGGKELKMAITIVRNDRGYGIYQLEIDG